MFKRGLFTLALVAGLLGTGMTSAHAIPPGENLIVVTFYSGTTVVGQKWWGCPGQPPGQWGVETTQRKLGFVPC